MSVLSMESASNFGSATPPKAMHARPLTRSAARSPTRRTCTPRPSQSTRQSKTGSCRATASRPRVNPAMPAYSHRSVPSSDISPSKSSRAATSTNSSSACVTAPWPARKAQGHDVKDGRVVRNIVEDVDRVPGKPKKFATYTPAQVEQVLRAIREDRNRHAWHLALSGLRRGEIGGLRWTNIDLETQTLTIGPTRISVDGKAVEQDDAKSKDSERTLPISAPLLVELKAAKKRQASEKLTLGAAYADLGYVVCNEAGQPYHPDTLSKMWTKAVAAAGAPHIRLHDARHTCGTTMHLQGVPAAVIAAWLGHADVAFTMRTYVHSQPDALAERAQSLARVVTIRDSFPGA